VGAHPSASSGVRPTRPGVAPPGPAPPPRRRRPTSPPGRGADPTGGSVRPGPGRQGPHPAPRHHAGPRSPTPAGRAGASGGAPLPSGGGWGAVHRRRAAPLPDAVPRRGPVRPRPVGDGARRTPGVPCRALSGPHRCPGGSRRSGVGRPPGRRHRHRTSWVAGWVCGPGDRRPGRVGARAASRSVHPARLGRRPALCRRVLCARAVRPRPVAGGPCRGGVARRHHRPRGHGAGPAPQGHGAGPAPQGHGAGPAPRAPGRNGTSRGRRSASPFPTEELPSGLSPCEAALSETAPCEAALSGGFLSGGFLSEAALSEAALSGPLLSGPSRDERGGHRERVVPGAKRRTTGRGGHGGRRREAARAVPCPAVPGRGLSGPAGNRDRLVLGGAPDVVAHRHQQRGTSRGAPTTGDPVRWAARRVPCSGRAGPRGRVVAGSVAGRDLPGAGDGPTERPWASA